MVSPAHWIRHQFWGSDKGLISLLALIVALIFVGTPLEASGKVGRLAQILTDVLLGAIVVTGTLAMNASRRTVVVVCTLVVVYALEETLAAGTWKPLASPLLSMLLFLVLSGLMLAQVFRPGHITKERILGAIAVYLLLALVWANLYTALVGMLPGSFGDGLSHTGLSAYPELLYFSLVTITTTGYGDITPVHPVVRAFANIESVAGVLYPSIFIARLLSLHGTEVPPKK